MDAVPQCDHGAMTLVPWDERGLRFYRPISLYGMEIGVTHTEGLQFHERFTETGCRNLEFGDLQRRTEFGADGGARGLIGVSDTARLSKF